MCIQQVAKHNLGPSEVNLRLLTLKGKSGVCRGSWATCAGMGLSQFSFEQYADIEIFF